MSVFLLRRARLTGTDELAESGTYTTRHKGVRVTVRMSCPRCGTSLELDGHTIDSLGFVWPTVCCVMQGCDFNEFVKLGDWHGG
jgi:hypothetical protein